MFNAIKAIFKLITGVTTVVADESTAIIQDSMQTIGHIARGANQIASIEIDSILADAKADLDAKAKPTTRTKK